MPVVNAELTKYINNALSKQIYHPSLSLCACIDAVFTGDDDPGNDKWWGFDYETVLETIQRLGYVKPNTNILGQIQCIAAIRNGKSFIDKEWNQFEKAVAALTGIPVLFYEKQNLPIENVLLAMKIMPQLGTIEYSDEVKHYIGCEAINDDIFWYPIKAVDEYLYQALDRIKYTLGFKIEEIVEIRNKVKAKFSELRQEELDNIVFDEESMEDQMCKRIMLSIYKYHDLIKQENEELNRFRDIRDEKIDFQEDESPNGATRDPGEDYSDVETGDSLNISLENTGEVTHYDDGINPDDPAEVEVLDFNDGVKEGAMEVVQDIISPLDDMPYNSQAIKIASFSSEGLDALPNIIDTLSGIAKVASIIQGPTVSFADRVLSRVEKIAAIPHPIGSSAVPFRTPAYPKSKTLEQTEYPDLQSMGITGGEEADIVEEQSREDTEPDAKTVLKTSEKNPELDPDYNDLFFN